MRKQCYYILLMIAAMGSSCGSESPTLFTMPMEVNFTIPAGLNTIDTHYFEFDNVPTFYRNYVNANNETFVDHINSGRAEINARLDNIDWGMLRIVEVHILDPQDRDRTKLAFYEDQIRFSNAGELRLLSAIPEFKDVILNDFVTVQLRLAFRRVPTQQIDGRLTMNFVAYGPEG